MLFKNSVRTSKRTLHFTITKINSLTLFKEMIAVYSESRKEQINRYCGHYAVLLNVKVGGTYTYHWISRCGLKPAVSVNKHILHVTILSPECKALTTGRYCSVTWRWSSLMALDNVVLTICARPACSEWHYIVEPWPNAWGIISIWILNNSSRISMLLYTMFRIHIVRFVIMNHRYQAGFLQNFLQES
jgi:hypothetical protein